jgi:DNA-binding transcriptional LysR family regulator
MKAQTNPMRRGRLKTRHIVLLVHLDEQRSVLRAARACHMTQPGASKLLSELEESLGVQLFRRLPRGVEPTSYGEVMTRHARSALAEMDRAQEEIAALRSGLTGEVAIGAVVNPGMNVVPAAVVSLKARHPRVLVRIEIDNSDVLVRRLLKGELDIAVARVPGFHDAGELSFEPLAGETHRVIARPAHPLAARRRLQLSDLVEQPWVLPPSGSLLREKLDSLFAHRGFGPPRNVVETASLPVITSLLQRADVVSALQAETVDPHCKAGLLTVLPIALGLEMEPFGIVTRRSHRISPSAEAMLATLREAAALSYAHPNATTHGREAKVSGRPRRQKLVPSG